MSNQSAPIQSIAKQSGPVPVEDAEDAVKAAFARQAERDADVQAWAFADREAALEEARRVSHERMASPVAGFTVGLKDIIDTADMPTAYGAAAWKGHRPQQDAVAVERLRAAGAVVIGKTVSTEFALYAPPLTRNPHNIDRSPGGSSSGSAAAVGDGQVRVALGTQTAGSVTRPGSFCGVYTFKPSYHRWSMNGVLPVSLTFDTLGAFARTPADLSALDAVIAAAGDATPVLRSLADLTVGILRPPWSSIAEPAAAAMLDRSADQMRSLGVTVVDLELSGPFDELLEAHALTQSHEALLSLPAMVGRDPDAISSVLREVLAAASQLTTDEIQEARRVLRQVRQDTGPLFDRVDVLVTLAAPGEAPTPESTGDPAFNRLASTCGLPAVGLPVGRGIAGLPLGLQVIGRDGSDRALLALLEQLAPEIAEIPLIPTT